MFSHLSRGKALAECHIHPLPVSLTGCLAEYNELPVTSPSFHFSLQRQVEKPDGPFAYLLILFFKFVSRHSGLYPSDILRLSTRGYIYLNKGFSGLISGRSSLLDCGGLWAQIAHACFILSQ